MNRREFFKSLVGLAVPLAVLIPKREAECADEVYVTVFGDTWKEYIKDTNTGRMTEIQNATMSPDANEPRMSVGQLMRQMIRREVREMFMEAVQR